MNEHSLEQFSLRINEIFENEFFNPALQDLHKKEEDIRKKINMIDETHALSRIDKEMLEVGIEMNLKKINNIVKNIYQAKDKLSLVTIGEVFLHE